MRKQRGITLSGLLVVSVVLIAVLFLVFKLFPAYTEYLAIKKAVNEIARNPESKGSAREIHAAFERRAAIDNINAVRGTDLEITKQGDGVVIGAAWSVKIPLFYNVNACIDFDVHSQ